MINKKEHRVNKKEHRVSPMLSVKLFILQFYSFYQSLTSIIISG